MEPRSTERRRELPAAPPAPDVAVHGLAVHDLSVGEPAGDAPVVVAVHGITANGLSWTRVAEEIARRRGPGSVRVLAPDLRGRGDSRAVAGPYGVAAHADDVLAIADALGSRPVLVGHSMGAFVVALAAARGPERVAGVALVDGGLAFPVPAGLDVDAALQAVIGPAMARLGMRFASPNAYVDFWRRHPAVGPTLDGPRGRAVRRFLLHDLVPAEHANGEWVSSCVLAAVRADGAGILADAEVHGAAAKAVAAGVPVELLWAERGLMDEPQGLYDEQRLAALGLPATIRVTPVPAVNHYTVVFADPGVAVVVDAVERLLDGAASA